MAILLVAFAGGLLAGALLGGSLANLERLSLRLAWFVVSRWRLQIVAFSPVGAPVCRTGSSLPCTSPRTCCLLTCVAANLGARR